MKSIEIFKYASLIYKLQNCQVSHKNFDQNHDPGHPHICGQFLQDSEDSVSVSLVDFEKADSLEELPSLITTSSFTTELLL